MNKRTNEQHSRWLNPGEVEEGKNRDSPKSKLKDREITTTKRKITAKMERRMYAREGAEKGR